MSDSDRLRDTLTACGLLLIDAVGHSATTGAPGVLPLPDTPGMLNERARAHDR